LNDQLNKKQAGQDVLAWFQSLKATAGFGPVPQDILEIGRRSFESERVSDLETLETIKSCYEQTGYVLDPHSAIGVAAAERSIGRTGLQMHHISLSTAHPAKFSGAVKLALKDDSSFNFEEQVLPPEFVALALAERRVTMAENSWEKVREIIKKQVDEDLKVEGSG
jgi:threonine synthase